MKKILLASSLIVLLAVGCNKNSIYPVNGNTNSASDSQTNSSADSNQSQSSKGPVKTYTSAKLGITFKYSDPDVSVKEVANKIYVYPSAMKPEEGQSVEVWSKPAAQTLADAVKKNFLTKSPAKCVVESKPADSGDRQNLETAVITVNGVKTDNLEEFFKEITSCPEGYSQTNGIRYFAMDRNVPTKFMFFSIGQYAIPGDKPGSDWVSTLTIK